MSYKFGFLFWDVSKVKAHPIGIVFGKAIVLFNIICYTIYNSAVE